MGAFLGDRVLLEGRMDKKKEITIICPVFNEDKSIDIFYSRYLKSINDLKNKYNFYLLFSDNRSTDKSLTKIKDIIAKDSKVGVICLSRNFGYQCSVQAALTTINSDASIVIDCDCEDPPEMLPELLQKFESGYDIVYGERVDRVENWLFKYGRNLFYRVLKRVGDYDVVLYMAEFALINSTVRKSIINNSNSYPFLRAEIGYVGFKRIGIPYKREERVSGRSSYNLFGMVVFAVAGTLTSSTFPLRFISYCLPFLFIFNLVMLSKFSDIIWILTVNLTYISICLCFLGIYTARIYKNVLNRPLFIIDDTQSKHKF
jgi:dolichol-phosphate mannosyltransferase